MARRSKWKDMAEILTAIPGATKRFVEWLTDGKLTRVEGDGVMTVEQARAIEKEKAAEEEAADKEEPVNQPA